MAKNIYALLVGINEYDSASSPPVPLLKGCINDIKGLEAYLRERVAKDSQWGLIEPWILINQDATRQSIINGFQQYLCNADSDDVVLFYYAGHGSQEKSPEEFWHLEPDHLDETLVCYDSRTPSSRDLADKELAYLISQVAQKNPHILIILDCCYSGSGTKYLSPEITVRRSPVDLRERPLNSFVFAEDKTALDNLLTSIPNHQKKTTGVVLPYGKHILFSACRDYELAKEYKTEDGLYRGIFSDFLLQTLKINNSKITYQDLARNINALVSSQIKDQSPQVETNNYEELNKPFLGGAISTHPLTHSQDAQSWLLPSLKVYIKGDTLGVELAQKALKTSKYLSETNSDADYHLLADNSQYWITHPIDNRFLVDPIPNSHNPVGYILENAILAIRRLENIARWHNILQLSSPANSQIKSDAVEMEVVIISGNQTPFLSEVRVEYTYENNVEKFPIIQIKLTNNSDKPLYCNVLDLSEGYTVAVPFFNQKSSIKLAAKGSAESNTILSFDNIGFIVPDVYWEQGSTEYKDIFKLIVSTTEFDASLLEQDGLNSPNVTSSLDSNLGTLDRLLLGVNSREVVKASNSNDDWLTKQVAMTVVRSSFAQSILPHGSTKIPNGLVEVLPHGDLQAKIKLTTIPQASKDLGNLIFPAILQQQPGDIELFQFTTSRGSDPGLSAVELTDVANYTVITPEAPLKLLVDIALAEHEQLLPFAFDGESFIPLGKGKINENGKTEITLERLARPIQGAISIFFAKYGHQKLGSLAEYPVLNIAELPDVITLNSAKNPERVTGERQNNFIQKPLPDPWVKNPSIEAPDAFVPAVPEAFGPDVPEAIANSQPNPSDGTNQEQENSGLNGVIVTAIALLTIVVAGLIIWKRSPQPQPQNPNKTSLAALRFQEKSTSMP